MGTDKAKKMLAFRYIIFSILAIAYVLVVFHRMSPAVIATDLSEAFSIGAMELGVLGSMYYYPYALMQIPCGILADTIGPRKLVTFSFLLAGAGAFIFGTAVTFEMALLGRFLIGLGVSCVYVPTLKILAVWFRKNEFATLSGIMGSLGALGGLLAAVPLAYLAASTGWRETIGIIGIMTLIMAGVAYFYVRNKPEDAGFPTIWEIDGVPTPTTETEKIPVMVGLKMVISNKHIWPLLVRGFMFAGAGLTLQSLWGGPFLMQVRGLSPMQTGSMLMMISVGAMIVGPVAGYLSDKVLKSRNKLTIPAAIMITAGWGVLAFWGDTLPISLFYVLFTLMGVGTGLGIASVGMAQAKELFPASLAGTVTGVINFLQMGGGAIFPVVLGYVIGQYAMVNGVYPPEAYSKAFLVVFICTIIGTIAQMMAKETMVLEEATETE